MATRVRVQVSGIVQGVGFRPFVHGLAGALGLHGQVTNTESGVVIEAEGDREAVHKFLSELRDRPPPLAVIEQIETTELPPRGGSGGFVIRTSTSAGRRDTLISPDIATCADCLAELADPADRRYRYPFINCTNCGPRFTIVTGVPYDRGATTMAGFPMCAECAREYHDPTDRRFHAQPTCCPACGPTVRLIGSDGVPLHPERDAIGAAVTLLRDGAILAVKGLGGYHLAALAGGPVGEVAVARLRARKHREDKPFAVLLPDLDAAAALVHLDGVATEVLGSRRRPIVLCPKREPRRGESWLAEAVAPGNRYLGVLLPYTPLHQLLVDGVAEPVVLTSGNVSDEPIAFRDDDAAHRLAPIADAFLVHDRPIHIRADDSVVRIAQGAPMLIRRSRGYAPEPMGLGWPAPRPILGCGAELKNTFCLAKGTRAVLSHHIGDLENVETLQAYTSGVAHLSELFDVCPELLAHDLHPEYLSTKYALEAEESTGVELLAVQHHHAHLAACLADNGVAGPVLGVACDGLGYGPDGTLWGGEVMVASLTQFRRLAHLRGVPMPGGVAAVREPWRMAAAYLRLGYGVDEVPDGAAALVERQGSRWARLGALLDLAELDASGLGSGRPSAVNTPLTSSAGRLFDAVASLVGIRDKVNFEGQAAIELEQAVDLEERGWYPARQEGPFLDGVDLVRGVVDDLGAGLEVGTVAARFHNGLVELLAGACVRGRAELGLDVVALSGGVFQNVILTRWLTARLRADGFEVLTHRRVPTNDAGISFGQVAVAAALDRERGGKSPLL
ncbi:MAG TPA: carbamoyltransferase HypF [Pseudonocardia sp.]|jgi:hydrogenase maturation protein HypF|nr:carbamoyltransferase HypF [Pseudonocardia sp.]